jgi:thiamine-monophosphate kinase
LTLSLSVVGEVAPARLKRRSGGRPGDVLALTGPLGASRAGLELTRRPLAVDAALGADALRAFSLPEPRVREGRWFAASSHVRAMMDTSDGLSTDLARLARASGCGATLDTVPVAAAAGAVAAAAGDDARAYALDGGEDFELLVAIERRAFEHLARRYAQRFGKPLLAIGKLDAEPGVRLREASRERELVAAGYDHLASE